MEISLADYERFKLILEKQSGILLGDNKQYLVVSRLSNLIQEKGLSSLSNLLDQISRPGGTPLLKLVVERMTTNETLWFRDRYPFEYLRSTIVPELRKKSFNFRIWCAACSTGQEPYSIAMQLDEMGTLNNSEIIATDLSDRVLTKARTGIYQQIELNRGMPQEKLKRFFSPADGGDWQVNTKLRNKIRYQPLNLLSLPYSLGKFDVIFCRNVLIYFSNENKTRVINGLIDNLKPGGYLFLGSSEALTRGSKPMKMVRCNPGLVYQKEA
ncbi:CheR family methyltransferase [Aliikangiella coralliicola]|uniref:protein-glutamate O-methyltransferase n=1 Tax=Aliikangiella coralliicola TaxID=2592383 RepID=A0A545U5X8_9GAMM|nr:protein-glutamate O-methyltransferase CheR [Aliikangiella coralliicola]TQV84874.1 protein-glutamate O-methyltransferase CheR [Aliikangiella coralliicola]